MKITKEDLPIICNRDFYCIEKRDGKKMIIYFGYFLKDGDGWTLVMYDHKGFPLEEYLSSESLCRAAVDATQDERVLNLSEEKVIDWANRMLGHEMCPLKVSSLTVNAPYGAFLDIDARELSLPTDDLGRGTELFRKALHCLIEKAYESGNTKQEIENILFELGTTRDELKKYGFDIDRDVAEMHINI